MDKMRQKVHGKEQASLCKGPLHQPGFFGFKKHSP